MMLENYSDITDVMGTPRWWDECGVPRYCEFAPSRVASVYWREAALVEIKCQACGQSFPVAFAGYDWRDGMSLAELIESKELHYGDPPNYNCCPAGPTMNSIPVRVLEFWQRGDDIISHERNTQYEVCILPDWAQQETTDD